MNNNFAMRYAYHLIAFLAATGLVQDLCADENTKQAACRSVHWGYQAPPGSAFYNEVTVDQSAEGTYFMVCGWRHGYFGLQELASGKKVIIFSVWEPTQTDRQQDVPEENRVRLVDHDEAVRIDRFGGEGTGGKSLFDYDWSIGKTYRFFVTSKIEGDRSEYAGYFYVPEQSKWKHLVTFSTPNGGKPLDGYYSFVEDFRRNGISATQARKARFGNGWVRTDDGKWRPLVQARFTADASQALNFDGGLEADRFFLTTGGETKNRTLKLGEIAKRPMPPADSAPQDLP